MENEVKEDISSLSIMERMLIIMNKIRIDKNGKNTFSNYDYFKPEEINKRVNPLFLEYKIFPHFTTYFKEFEISTNESIEKGSIVTQKDIREIAQLKLTDILNPKETIVYEMPLKEIEIKGANKMQNVGGVRTYAKRYLYMEALNISENKLDLDSDEMTDKKNSKPTPKDAKVEPIINDIKLKIEALRKDGVDNVDIANAIKTVYIDGGKPSANYVNCKDIDSAKKILDVLNNKFQGK